MWFGFADAADGRQAQIPHDQYMEAINLKDDHFVMQNILLYGLQVNEPGRSVEYYQQNASFFSMILLLSGVTPRHYYLLDEAGIDIIHAITSDDRPFSEQSLLADLVVLGTVTDLKPDDTLNDGFAYNATIEIEQMLKGAAPTDTVYIRQRSSAVRPGSGSQLNVGSNYLFLLSSGVYGYQSAGYRLNRRGEVDAVAPSLGEEETFVIYRLYPFRNGRLIPSTYTFDEVKSQLQVTDRIIHGK
ncbi:MAG: hypothetical protein JJU37_07805 [Balneolaceae bacterium]|nr:hypothetical protein [Balneolaceae bacterium]